MILLSDYRFHGCDAGSVRLSMTGLLGRSVVNGLLMILKMWEATVSLFLFGDFVTFQHSPKGFGVSGWD